MSCLLLLRLPGLLPDVTFHVSRQDGESLLDTLDSYLEYYEDEAPDLVERIKTRLSHPEAIEVKAEEARLQGPSDATPPDLKAGEKEVRLWLRDPACY